MADCKIVNDKVAAAIANIGGATTGENAGLAASYKAAGEEFIEALHNAISEMEGETKDALLNFFDTSVQTYVVESIPQTLNGMSVLLEANRDNFEKVDKQIAESISSGN